MPAMIGLSLGIAPAARSATPAPPRLPDVVAQVLPTVVAISATKVEGGPSADGKPPKVGHERGSGFIIDPEGFIVTNKHVIDGATEIQVRLHEGSTLPATLVGKSEKADIALLQVHPVRPLPSARFGDSDALRVGDDVIAIGNPLGFDNSVSAGIVSALNRNIMESPFDDYIQTDAAINHGNSGGPLFDMAGVVVGMNSVIFAPGTYGGSIGLGFAIPSADVRFVVDQIRRYGYVRAGFIGIQFQDLSEQLKDSLGLPVGSGGAIVVQAASDGPGGKAGIRLGDVVLEFGGRRITDARALARAVAAARIGAKTPVEVWRDNAVLRFNVVATVAPDASPSGVNGPAFPMASAKRMAQSLGLTLAEDTAATDTGNATQAVAAPDAKEGAVVTGVTSSSAAADAGLAVGDVILMTDRGAVDGSQALMRALQTSRMSGRPFTPLLVRDPAGNLRWIALSSKAKT